MSEMRTQYPHLAHLLGAYFHQDWNLDDPDAQAVLRRYAQEVSSRKRKAAGREAARLLAAGLTEDELSAALEALGSAYDPSPDGQSCSAWLKDVEQALMK